tara:strand:- start:3519 stop:3737 length:219 start_codon:yes stop_codon:yes gene_type:complete
MKFRIRYKSKGERWEHRPYVKTFEAKNWNEAYKKAEEYKDDEYALIERLVRPHVHEVTFIKRLEMKHKEGTL